MKNFVQIVLAFIGLILILFAFYWVAMALVAYGNPLKLLTS